MSICRREIHKLAGKLDATLHECNLTDCSINHVVYENKGDQLNMTIQLIMHRDRCCTCLGAAYGGERLRAAHYLMNGTREAPRTILIYFINQMAGRPTQDIDRRPGMRLVPVNKHDNLENVQLHMSQWPQGLPLCMDSCMMREQYLPQVYMDLADHNHVRCRAIFRR
jgi:hypothetical protein